MKSIDQVISEVASVRDGVRSVRLREFGKRYLFDAEGRTYLPTHVTEETKEVLRDRGYKYLLPFGFHGNVPVYGVPTVTVRIEDCCEWDARYWFFRFDTVKATKAVTRAMSGVLSAAERGNGFAGVLGNPITCVLHYDGVRMVTSNSDFGDLAVMNFHDDEGRRFSWLQRSYSAETMRDFVRRFSRGDEVVVKGRVKAHETRIGKQTTMLSRCEIVGTARAITLCEFAKQRRERQRRKSVAAGASDCVGQ